MHTLSIQRLTPIVKSQISNLHPYKVTRVQCRPMQQQCVLTQSQRFLTYAKNVPTHFQRVLTHSRRVVTNSRRILTHSQRLSRRRNVFSCAPNAFSCTFDGFPHTPNCSHALATRCHVLPAGASASAPCATDRGTAHLQHSQCRKACTLCRAAAPVLCSNPRRDQPVLRMTIMECLINRRVSAL